MTMSTLRLSLVAVVTAVALLVAPVTAASADDDQPSGATEVVVKLDPVSGATIEQVNATYGTTTIKALLGSRGIYLLAPPPVSDADAVVAAMSGDARLHYVEPNFPNEAPEGNPLYKWSGSVPTWLGTSQTRYNTQYAGGLLGLPAAHQRSRGAGAVVAVLDTGAQLDHPALSGRLAAGGYDFVDDDASPAEVRDRTDNDRDGRVDEGFGHGTHVAGVVALVAPDARVLPLRVLDSDGVGSVFTAAEAVLHAQASGADVVTMSFGTTAESKVLGEAIEQVLGQGVVVVASAGNTGTRQEQYPAADDDVLGVTSTGKTDVLSGFANRGPWIAVAAPGEAIVSTFPVGGYARWSGTSMAAPFVAGQAALLRGADQGVSVDAVRSAIQSTAVPLGPDAGAGRIDVARSLTTATVAD